MTDIFISYSSKDRAQAEQLTELLASAGLSVWIDRQGIVGAEQWATEIVEGIKACSTFILLLSPRSVESENVLRELSLASEKRKRVLPVNLEATVLPSSFEYPLAGLQRVPLADLDRIIHAHKYGLEKTIIKDDRKSLMILPFEDLSADADNGWFVDGIISELIGALSHIRSLRIADARATKEFKRYHGKLTDYAQEMNYRYFLQGEVRKQGEHVKISTRLLDIETGSQLWQDSFKGTMADIFEIQEEVARNIVQGLKIHLTTEEQEQLTDWGTSNAEAYELYLRANEYSGKRTRETWKYAIQLFEEAILLDPTFARAYTGKSLCIAEIYRLYDRNEAALLEAEALVLKAQELDPESAIVYNVLCMIYLQKKLFDRAEAAAKRYLELSPTDYASHFAVGFYYCLMGQVDRSVPHYQASIGLDPTALHSHFNLILALDHAAEPAPRIAAAQSALPFYKKHLLLFPDDEHCSSNYANVLYYSGELEQAKNFLRTTNMRDGLALYNMSCLAIKLKENALGLEILRNSISAGFTNIDIFLQDPDLEPLRGTPEFDGLIKEVEAKIARA